ncbi:hypothetical protein V8E36_004846, partial [Tilletia maclaganii]
WASHITLIVSLVTLAVGLGSSAYSGAIESLHAHFGGSQTELTLGVSLWVLGFLLISPASLATFFFGRRSTLLVSYAFLTLWNGMCICAPNLTALLIFRFLAGAFGASQPTHQLRRTIADIFPASQRGLGMAIFCAAPFLGPSLGPIAGGFLAISYGWRSVMIFLTILSGSLLLLAALCLPETYAPVLLRERCARLEKATGKKYIALVDKGKNTNYAHILKLNLIRPWQLIAFSRAGVGGMRASAGLPSWASWWA